MYLKFFRAITCFCLIFWMVLIFSFSSQDSTKSDETSTGFIEKTASIVVPGYEKLTDSEKTELVDSLQFTVRKMAHFSVYTFLGIFSFLTFVSYRQLLFKWRVIISSGVCLLYAASDEFHQLFVSGRSGEIRDVCIDFCGSMFGLGICLLITRFNKRINKSVGWSRDEKK